MNYKQLYVAIILLLTTLSYSQLAAQTNQDFSTIKVDQLSDAQIRQFMAQVKASGLSDAQLEQVAQAKGMPAAEVQKLRQRVERLGSQDKASPNASTASPSFGRSVNKVGAIEDEDARKDSLNNAATAISALRPKLFGADLFTNKLLSFEPDLRLATPGNYQIGPDDELLIDLYGNSEASYKLRVSPEGTINVQYVGVINVAGLTVDAATSRIRSRLSKIYSGLASGGTKLNVALGNIRSVKVILTGEVRKPGTYTLPSLATVFNALYASGGPTDNGSFRSVQLIRAGKTIATLDIYDFLLHGQFKNNFRLQDQDVIRVPAYNRRVEVTGEVKHPAIFEMKQGEHLNELIAFAGGFTEKAYKARIKVLKNTDIERRIDDITAADFASYTPNSGDKYFVDAILDRFENRVTINGAVFRPGQFELTKGLTLTQLILKADGLREDAFTNRGYITRLKYDTQTELVSFDLAKIMAGQVEDISLKREDVISISSIYDLREQYHVAVEGAVRSPGRLKYAEGMSLEDAIMQAGGLKESATTERVEISRRIKNSNVQSSNAVTTLVFQVKMNETFLSEAAKFILEPFDIVSVRTNSGYADQRMVRIEGEVMYPGVYAITRKDERISDLVKRAGGFTAFAYPEGASFKREGPPVEKDTTVTSKREKENINRFKQLKKDVNDTVQVADAALFNDYVGIDLPRILKNEGNRQDLFLEEGDVLMIPKLLQTVKVAGEVLSPATVVYNKNKSFQDYISSTGGFGLRAKKGRAYVVYANGTISSTSRFLFFTNYPAVKPGAQIFVPKKEMRQRLTSGEIIGMTTGIASLAAIIVSLIR